MKLTRNDKPVRMVNTEDSAVTPKNGATGWINEDAAKCSRGAVVALLQPVSFFAAQEAEQAGSDKGEAAQVVALVKASLVGFEGCELTPEEFLKDPHPPVLLSMFNAVHRLTWGND